MKAEVSRMVVALATLLLIASTTPVAAQQGRTFRGRVFQPASFADGNVTTEQPPAPPVPAIEAEDRVAADVGGAWEGECRPACDGRCYWYAGVDAVFLAPNFKYTQAQFAATDLLNNVTNVSNANAASVENNLYAAPRLRVGLQGECWGLVGRYWELQASETAFDPLSDTAGYVAQDRLDAYTVDLEVTRLLCWRNCFMNMGLGVRHAGFDRDTMLTAMSAFPDGGFPPPFLSSTMPASSQFYGTGITCGLTGRKPIRYGCSSVISLYWSLRGSVLWGDVDNMAEQTTSFGSGLGSIAISEIAETTVSDDLFIGELQLGLQWEYCLQCLPARAFFRTAFEYQGWDANGGLAGEALDLDASPLAFASAFVSTSDVRMDLVGFSVGTGFMW